MGRLKAGDRVLVAARIGSSRAHYGVVVNDKIKMTAHHYAPKKNVAMVQVHFEVDGHNSWVYLDDVEKTDYEDHGRGIERPEWRP